MPTGLSTIDSRTESVSSHQECGAPLRVLAHIPWLSRREVSDAAPSKTGPSSVVTHFEYLMGEFGLNCEAALPLPEAPSTAAQKEQLVPEPAPPVATMPSFAPAKESDWSDILLRLDTLIEPYSRAIVLLLLLAVVAFTVLLLRPTASATVGNTEQAIPAEQTLPESTSAKRKAASSERMPAAKPSSRSKQQLASKTDPPIAEVSASQPPIASLGANLQMVPGEIENEPAEYPSEVLPLASGGNSPARDADNAPREARRHDSGNLSPSNQ